MSGPVVCVSYLAAASLWKVPCFPLANHGAEVQTIEHSIAADAPMVAAVLTALGVPSLLLSNCTGTDVRGAEVRRWLQAHEVATTAKVTGGWDTPEIVVVADDTGTRTWFPYLPGVVDAMAALDFTPMAGAPFAYIDCYQLIEAPAVCAIRAARAAGVPLLLNLGGTTLSPRAAAAVRGYPRLFIQTNVDDADHADASRSAASLLAATGAEWIVVTAGAYGAVAVSRADHVGVPAFRAAARHTHCAGAAFSGGLLYGLLHDWPISDSLDLACASGALRCERAHHEPMPALAELLAFIGSRERTWIPAA